MKVPRPGQGLLLGHQPAVQPGRGAALREAEEGCDAAKRGAAGGHDGAAADLLADAQTRQLKLLLAEQSGAEAGSLPSLYPGPAPAGVPRPPARPWTRQVG